MEDNESVFYPPRHPGTVIQGFAAVFFAATAGVLYYRAAISPLGGAFLGYLLGALALTLPVPFLLYGAYALQRAAYAVDRNRLVLQWGWWLEEVPMQEVLWARLVTPSDDLPLPRVRWPGKLTGRRMTGDEVVHFMAAGARGLVLIAAEGRRYVISPADPEAFLRAFRRAAEEGVLEAGKAHSRRPAHWLSAIWADRWARGLLLSAWALVIAALVWSNLAASQLVPAAPNSIDRAVLLSVAAWLFQGLNLGLGLFAYQSPRRRALAYLVWLVGALSAAGFLASVGVVLGGAV